MSRWALLAPPLDAHSEARYLPTDAPSLSPPHVLSIPLL
mgnify:CR=1 FL=1